MIIIAAMALMSIAATAQETKFAFVDFNEVIMLMPEMDAARATLEENQATNQEILVAMYDEYQSKMQQYQQKQATWTPAIRESKENEIMEIQARLEQTQQSLQQELQELQNSLQAPIYEKAQISILPAPMPICFPLNCQPILRGVMWKLKSCLYPSGSFSISMDTRWRSAER